MDMERLFSISIFFVVNIALTPPSSTSMITEFMSTNFSSLSTHGTGMLSQSTSPVSQSRSPTSSSPGLKMTSKETSFITSSGSSITTSIANGRTSSSPVSTGLELNTTVIVKPAKQNLTMTSSLTGSLTTESITLSTIASPVSRITTNTTHVHTTKFATTTTDNFTLTTDKTLSPNVSASSSPAQYVGMTSTESFNKTLPPGTTTTTENTIESTLQANSSVPPTMNVTSSVTGSLSFPSETMTFTPYDNSSLTGLPSFSTSNLTAFSKTSLASLTTTSISTTGNKTTALIHNLSTSPSPTSSFQSIFTSSLPSTESFNETIPSGTTTSIPSESTNFTSNDISISTNLPIHPEKKSTAAPKTSSASTTSFFSPTLSMNSSSSSTQLSTTTIEDPTTTTTSQSSTSTSLSSKTSYFPSTTPTTASPTSSSMTTSLSSNSKSSASTNSPIRSLSTTTPSPKSSYTTTASSSTSTSSSLKTSLPQSTTTTTAAHTSSSTTISPTSRSTSLSSTTSSLPLTSATTASPTSSSTTTSLSSSSTSSSTTTPSSTSSSSSSTTSALPSTSTITTTPTESSTTPLLSPSTLKATTAFSLSRSITVVQTTTKTACGKVDQSANIDVTYIPSNTSHFGTMAVLQCKPGYEFFNNSQFVTLQCSKIGTWAGNLSSTCSPVECKNLTFLSNGNMSSYNRTVKSVVEYDCNDGYTLVGFKSRVCLGSGKWSGSHPMCSKTPAKTVTPCPKDKDSRELTWNDTAAGQIISISCFSLNKNLSGEISRKCTKEGTWLLPNYNCTRKEFEAIKHLVNGIKDNATEDFVDCVLNELSSLTNQSTSQTVYSGEIEAVTDTLAVIAKIDYTKTNLTDSQSQAFLNTTSNLLDTSNADSWKSIDQESADAEAVTGASKVLNIVSTYTAAITNSLSDSKPNRTIEAGNILLQVRRLNNHSEEIKFPDENDKHNFSSTLVLPKESLRGSTSFSSVIYKNLSGVLSTNASFNGENLELGSAVMSVKLNNFDGNDDFKITMTFKNFKEKNVVANCSYRNESSNVWARDGCIRTSYNSSETVCECNHLTNFAILMSPWTKEDVETKAIRIISIVGCSISMLGLVVTMLTHICYWRYVKSDRVRILMNLCIALLISYGLFLGGVDMTSNKDVCTTMAVLLQYIYLVVFFLMLAEGIEISIMVLYVFTTKSRLKWILPCAWLIPALIVGISLAVTQTKGYGNEDFCWLSVDNGLIWAFVGPALLIILTNFVLLTLVIKAIFKTKNLLQKSKQERTVAGIRCLCVLLPLVGSTWVIGIFYVNESMAWIQYVFAICNSLQGLAIFIFHCALNTQIRQAYKRRRTLYESSSYIRSTSNPLIIPRATTSQSATDLYDSINSSFGTDATLQRRRPFHGFHENRAHDHTNIEMTRYPRNRDKFDDWY